MSEMQRDAMFQYKKLPKQRRCFPIDPKQLLPHPFQINSMNIDESLKAEMTKGMTSCQRFAQCLPADEFQVPRCRSRFLSFLGRT